jgi:hypothetical protein
MAATDFAFKRRREGRARALNRLKRIFQGARFQGARLDDPATAIWSILRPLDMGARKGVVVDYLTCGFLPDGMCIAKGCWTLEVSDHAVGRIWQRSGRVLPASRQTRL